MLTLLVPVDGSPGSDRAVELVIKLHRDVTPVRIRLLHVLPPNDGIAVDSTRPLVGPDKDPLIGPDEEPADGKLALSSARALLDRAEIPYGSEVRTGFVPSTIIQYARTMDCNGIVMGTRGMGTTEALLGSIARQVIYLADVPVTLVK
jgi:nucleotide-binding universal stress UspA family protein